MVYKRKPKRKFKKPIEKPIEKETPCLPLRAKRVGLDLQTELPLIIDGSGLFSHVCYHGLKVGSAHPYYHEMCDKLTYTITRQTK